MLQEIVSNTPFWVWPLLAFLIYRGVLASVDRETSLKKLFIIPTVMLGLSIQGVVGSFGAHGAAGPAWIAGLAVGTLATWMMFSLDSVNVTPERGTVFQHGSWLPLALMMGIFLTKYAVGVLLAMSPLLRQETGFVVTVCTLYGLFNGMFLGRLLRIVAIYRLGVARIHKLL
ncbi:DUF6622 family protein [Noviherbaspirillum saxi]|uniref:Transmembrane protein n=1 Tax=Noviherbaspirillum saxi TaxID=2320863 RepID=A0A3A3FRT6_9BURK|nr:DUF6622 family protein [Noviherbaspirillum saxi]RJF97168.1 hypothetical protein D3871_00430 [Noviherbaspirillum saxi]